MHTAKKIALFFALLLLLGLFGCDGATTESSRFDKPQKKTEKVTTSKPMDRDHYRERLKPMRREIISVLEEAEALTEG